MKECSLCFIHRHTLIWAKLKIFSSSTTPCLKTIIFLCSHKHLTIATHMPFQTQFYLWFRVGRQNCSKWHCKPLCWTDWTPAHLRQWSHTHWATLLAMKRYCVDSLSLQNITHRGEGTVTPLLNRHTLVVGNLSNITLHVVTNTLGKALVSHSCLNTQLGLPLVHLLRHSL